MGQREALPRTWFSSVRRVDEKKGQVDQGIRGATKTCDGVVSDGFEWRVNEKLG